MYIRFVVDEIDEDSCQRKGIFQAISGMKKQDDFYDYELDYIAEVMGWFDENLESPLDYLNKQKSQKSDVYISWFIESASEHIAKVREFVFLVESKGVVVSQIRTVNPGKIVYSDEFQIFAKPFTRF
ncbi:hypothetical protein [Vibrio sinaloensis]|uniref:hypothetical protein n=1 Tax=Photobacterium sp. (strain ATCC 43367) TaxID=379097 RepID=UPI0022AFAEF1|nr:hypothetical protein [Vibrio sinaloensis]MCZ4293308.1 hypothetical protein [Vibrio sinaloensis]